MTFCIKFLYGLLFLVALGSGPLHAQNEVGKQAFYNALASNSVSVLNKQLSVVKQLQGEDRTAFEGTLLMRKAGALTVPSQKLSVFKKGYKLLEQAIGKEPGNAEFRFLRLMIQENAPKVLGYHKNMAEDAKAIKSNLKALPKETQQAILVYSKSSKLLMGL